MRVLVEPIKNGEINLFPKTEAQAGKIIPVVEMGVKNEE